MKSRITQLSIVCFFLLILLGTVLFIKNFPSSQHVTEPCRLTNQSGDPLVVLTGKLRLKFFPDSSEASIFEDGGSYCWILELDRPSFLMAITTPVTELALDLEDIVRQSNANLVTLGCGQDLDALCQPYENKNVIVEGYLFHAHTAHHPTPLLLDLKRIFLDPI